MLRYKEEIKITENEMAKYVSSKETKLQQLSLKIDNLAQDSASQCVINLKVLLMTFFFQITFLVKLGIRKAVYERTNTTDRTGNATSKTTAAKHCQTVSTLIRHISQ